MVYLLTVVMFIDIHTCRVACVKLQEGATGDFSCELWPRWTWWCAAGTPSWHSRRRLPGSRLMSGMVRRWPMRMLLYVIMTHYIILYIIIYIYIWYMYNVCDDITCANSPTITVAIDTVTGSKNRLILHYYFLRIYEGFNQQEMTNKIWDYSLQHTYI